ncbi:HET-domain-containing protein [Hyaloscypha bicolor E]|uniref:HET-domain-containing protein n=1 Tax=Hyaloscypha bicolor E TaxID=1095630 RepID=A0A2J6T8J2_9HELO|nr:HET-domain-containing protein [Hyaloscypha bicolor E]PMD59337.1 HET-domain-containing protein [Hyaloscypha bicolor E]
MWLINTSTLSLEPFYGFVPAYAILSHTWEHEEVSFKEFVRAREDKNFDITKKAGYHKIIATCKEAVKEGCSYAWVDTCCIDKTSSAELTEAINSMFSWYRQSKICFVYLNDFELREVDGHSRSDEFATAFRRCRWFTRGWTLQELLAPRHVRFLNSQWEKIGMRNDLYQLIASATGLPKSLLLMPPRSDVRDFHVATRISWLAKRQTTRVEDLSYSLLGILDVNMPMLYGEGAAAFTRLQEEIIKKYNDLSIFAWTKGAIGKGYMDILAPAPSAFAGNVGVNYHKNRKAHLAHRLSVQFSLTNQGILFPNVRLQYQGAVPGFSHHYILDLKYPNPAFRGQNEGLTYILLRKVGPGLFVRLYESLERQNAFRGNFYSSAFYESVCILNNLKASNSLVWQLSRWEHYAIRLRWKPWEKLGQRFWHIRMVEPRAIWDVAGNQFLLEMATERYMHVEFIPGTYASNPHFKSFVIMIQVYNAKERDPARIKARIVKIETWQSLNVTTLGFRGKSAVEMDSLQSLAGGDESNTLSIVGYAISVSVRLHEKINEAPCHLVSLDWTETASS